MALSAAAHSLPSPAPQRERLPIYEDWLLLRDLERFLTTWRRPDLQSPRLAAMVEELEPRLERSLVSRRAARGMGRLSARLRSIGAKGPSPLDRLVLLLETADDLTIRLVHPECGWRGRFHLTGIECNRHLLEEIMPLLAGSLGRSIANNPALLRHAYGNGCTPLFHSPFALYSNPDICRILDSETGLESPDRIWNPGSPRDFPVIDGVPTAFLGPPPHSAVWPRERLFPEMTSQIEMLDD